MGGSIGVVERQAPAPRTAITDPPMVRKTIKTPGMVYPNPKNKPPYT